MLSERRILMKKLVNTALAAIVVFTLSSCGTDAEVTLTPAPAGNSAEEILSCMTAKQKVGQLFCVSFTGTELSENVRDFFEEYSVGNVILFSKNIADAAQTASLCREIQSEIRKNTGADAFIGTDQEGGTVVRITDGALYYPGAMAMAAAGSADYVCQVGEYMGAELKALGINIDFAPVADINSNPDNPVIGARSFGDSAATAGEYAVSFVNGMNASGMVSTAKHYPGHGDTDTDSHYGLPMIDKSVDELMDLELVPFKKLIENNIPAVMAAHIIYPQIDAENPASMSKTLLTDVLRNKLGFNGIIVTDSLRMSAVADNFGTANACVAAISAGADLLITGSGGESEDLSLDAQSECIERVLDAVNSGEIAEETLDAAVLRILKCKSDYAVGESGFKALSSETLETHKELAREISRRSVTLVKDERGAIPIAEGKSVLTISSDKVKRLDESDIKTAVPMAEYMAEKAGGGAEIIPPLSGMSESEIETLAEKFSKTAGNYDEVIFCVSGAAHIRLANAVIEKNPDTVVVAFDTPYMLRGLNSCKTFICAYEYTSDAVESVAAVLTGDAEPIGQLPVSITR